MDPDIERMAQILVMIGAFSAFVVTLSIVARFGFRMTRTRTLPAPEGDARIDESRFARLEDAVDSIAIEVERIAEAQRFTAKLMSERLPDRLPASASDRDQQR